MDMMRGILQASDVTCAGLAAAAAGGRPVRVHGMVHAQRQMGDFSFVVLRLADGLLQCVVDQATVLTGGSAIRDEYSIRGEGSLIADERAPGGYELHLSSLDILSRPNSPRPVP